MIYREITVVDIPALFAVRTGTHENFLTREELTGMGITDDSVARMLSLDHRGWLCEIDGRIVGFAIGNRATGEMWVIAVLPEFLGRGIGAELLSRVETWLFESGCARLWLTTDIDPTLKAYGFYLRQGWVDDRIQDGLRIMVKTNPNR